MKCDLLKANRKMSKSNTNPDEYPMRYIMKVARNFSSSTKKDMMKQLSSKCEIKHSRASSEPASSLQNFQEWKRSELKTKKITGVFATQFIATHLL